MTPDEKFQHLVEKLKPYFHEGWPADLAIGYGWVDLVSELHDKIVELLPNYTINQVKEKFGGLRFYISTHPNVNQDTWSHVTELIDSFEQKSFSICETCGEPGTSITTGYWVHTLCENHAK